MFLNKRAVLLLNAGIVSLAACFASVGCREVFLCDVQQKSVKDHNSVIGSYDAVRVVLVKVDWDMVRRDNPLRYGESTCGGVL